MKTNRIKCIQLVLSSVFPKDISGLVIKFCDVYNRIESHTDITHIINTGYERWVFGLCSRGYIDTELSNIEMQCKNQIWQWFPYYITPNNTGILRIDSHQWAFFLQHFIRTENQLSPASCVSGVS